MQHNRHRFVKFDNGMNMGHRDFVKRRTRVYAVENDMVSVDFYTGFLRKLLEKERYVQLVGRCRPTAVLLIDSIDNFF